MEVQLLDRLNGHKLNRWQQLLESAGLAVDTLPERTVLVWEDDELIATGSRQGNLLKYLAVAESHQGEDLTAKVLTELRQDAFRAGIRHLFLYTKPQNKYLLSSLFFYPVAQTASVLLMEDRPNGIREFLAGYPAEESGPIVGAAVMNCNPFTLGHRYLIEQAAMQCDRLYVFVLSEEQPPFPAADRLELVRRGTRDIPNVTVLPTGPYLLSAATFPTYFLQDREQAGSIQCALDLEIFTRYYAPHFHITRRFVGTEPLSPMTAMYNEALKEALPKKGIELIELPRLEIGGVPISASAVRALLGKQQAEAVRALVPQVTFDYLRTHDLIEGGPLCLNADQTIS